MTSSISIKTWTILFAGLTALILGIGVLVVQTADFKLHSDLLSLAVTADITIGIPLLYYFIVSRKLKAPPITALIVFLICTGIASLILPNDNQFYLDKIKLLLIFTELSIVIYGVIMVRKIVRAYRTISAKRNDFVYNLTEALKTILGKSNAISFVVGEINTFRYGLFFWLGKKEILSGQSFYTTHKKSGYVALWSVLFFVMLIETVGVHLLLWNWNQGVAIAAIILSIYTILFLIADLSSILKRPVIFLDNKLYLRIGTRWNAIIDPKQILTIETIKNFDKEQNKGTLDCALAGSPNVKITMTTPIVIVGFYGIKKTVTKFVFNIDNATEFIEEIKHYR